MKKYYLILLLLGTASFAFTQDRLAVIGSSTAAGQGAYPADSGWVRRVNYYYKYQQQVVDTTYKLAVGGYTCYKGMPSSYVPPPDKTPADYYSPDIYNNVTVAVNVLSSLSNPSNGVIIVNYPSNGYDVFSIQEIMSSLQTIYDSATRFGNRCYITTTQPRSDANFGTSAIKKKMADIKDSIINRFGVENTLNFWDGMFNPADTTILPQYSAGDNIHFNNAGHAVLAQRVIAKNVFTVAPLPVRLDTFRGTLAGGEVILSWMLCCSEPKTVVSVQRSTDSTHFETLAMIAARVQPGSQQYVWSDKHPVAGTARYRLEISSAGGKIYSKVIAVSNNAVTAGPGRIYPVPATTEINIPITGIVRHIISCSIMNAEGYRLMQYSAALAPGQKLLSLPVASLPHGNYFVQVAGSQSTPLLYRFVK